MPRSQAQREVEITEVRGELIEIQKRLRIARKHYIRRREDWLMAKADYENAHAKIYTQEKAKNPEATQNDLEALADAACYADKIKTIKTESKMKVVEIHVKELEDQLEAVLEDSRTYRAELKTGFQG